LVGRRASLPFTQTILIIEDDADTRTIVRRLFAAEGYRVCEAADGLTAFALARQCIPDLIMLDLGLPGQDGWAVARELRADPALDHVPILVITANGSSAAHRLARSAGCQAIICKPFTLETVEETVVALLQQHEAPRPRPITGAAFLCPPIVSA
jgi:DNA-binding response OmpR family regulator